MVYRLARAFFKFYFKVFNRTRFKGLENVVTDGPLIVYANHFSDCDVFLISAAFDRVIRFMAKKSLFETPIVRKAVKAYRAFPVDRDGNDLAAIKTAFKILKSGGVLGIFPEGTRIRNGKVSDPKGGFAMIAYKTKTTVQPVHLKYKRKFLLFNSIDVIVGKPIKWDELGVTDATSEDYTKVSRELMEKVYNLE